MKKLFYLFLAISFAACSNDESDDNINNDISIIGKWYVIKYEFYENDVLDEVDNVKQYETNGCRSYFDIKSDYTLEYGTYFTDCSGFDGKTFGTWDWLKNSNTLRLNYNSGTYDWTVLTFDETNLTIEIEECNNLGCERQIEFYER